MRGCVSRFRRLLTFKSVDNQRILHILQRIAMPVLPCAPIIHITYLDPLFVHFPSLPLPDDQQLSSFVEVQQNMDRIHQSSSPTRCR
mmetsp:Transcript_27349/g.38856  ORF Transcript_27349/g.38856 Transcript_27349/m.38856 type:complete len:87 (+) Transcript_27349:193-453(+)